MKTPIADIITHLPTAESPVTVLQGDCRKRLADLPDGSIHCCVTSPPYFGLRNYGHAEQMGLEPTPDEYVAGMVEVFREVWRVLRDDGTLFINIGDSYAGTKQGNTNGGASSGLMRDGRGESSRLRTNERLIDDMATMPFHKKTPPGLKPKDLIGIPWLLAFALRDDGWYLRQEIIWAKKNPLPESVTDRCTKSHESIFLLSKRPRYYFDAAAIAEPSANPELAGKLEKSFSTSDPTSSLRADVGREVMRTLTRNKRNVWWLSSSPYKGAHFATFPPKLVEPCILAGCPEGGIVLDPFAGSGTTLAVAVDHGRRAVGIELNPDYVALIEERVGKSTARARCNLFADEAETIPNVQPDMFDDEGGGE